MSGLAGVRPSTRAVVGGGGIVVETDLADGARITSLRAAGREWLEPSGPRTPGDYLQAGSGGWDEIAPTISGCVLEDGTVLADHGDAWQSEWTRESVAADHVQARVRLASAPITLVRRIQGTPTGIRLSWTAHSDADRAVPLFWSAHPLFAADEGTRVRVEGAPPLVEEYPRRGAERAWPGSVGSSAVKAFAAGGVSSASVVHGDGSALTLSWDPELLPHLGLYWDGGEFSAGPVVAIEPATAHGDSARRAIDEGRLRVLAPGVPAHWWIELAVSQAGAP